MIELKNISYHYNKSNKILENINLNIEDGKITAIVGKNGSGKSTLLNLIGGLLKPTKGEILVDGIKTKSKKNFLELRKKIGIVFQNPESQILFPRVYDEVEFVLKNMNIDYNEELIHQVLAEVNMDELYKSNSFDLSMGQKQRLNIACALSHKPKYLLFDEPTTMIDSYEKENFYNIIKKLKAENYTIVFVTNNATELLLADRIIVVENAQIKDQFSKKSILNKLDMLEQSKIEIPNLLKLLLKLKKKNIKFKLKEWTIEEIMEALVEAVDNG